MSRLRTEDGEQESRLRELEAELDSELGLSSSTVTTRRAKKTRSGAALDYGKLALYGLGAYVLLHFLGAKLISLLALLSLLLFLGAGVMWLINLFKGKDD